MRCPCCSQEIASADFSVEELNNIAVSGAQRLIMKMLIARHPGKLSHSEMIDRLWSGPNCGPDSANLIVPVHVTRLRKKLEPFGWTIPRNTVYRSKPAFYWLEKIESQTA